MANSDILSNNNDNNNDYHHENDLQMSSVEQLRQQMQQLHELETSMNELRKTIINTSLTESKVMQLLTNILHFVLIKQMFYK
jgi:hypothetical protein